MREKKVLKKLPNLLTEGETTEKNAYNEYRKYEHKIRRAVKKGDVEVRKGVKQISDVLDELDVHLSGD